MNFDASVTATSDNPRAVLPGLPVKPALTMSAGLLHPENFTCAMPFTAMSRNSLPGL